jgi:nucleotide-binding universal stress UspA family protein
LTAGRPRRQRGLAAQPTASANVLLATTDGSFTDEAIRLAARVAGDTSVAVVVITRIHGYALGIPNPGLLPTRREQDSAKRAATEAVRALRRHGIAADGQVAATRTAAKTISRIARTRSARHIVLDGSGGGSRLRRLVEGDPAAGLRRRVDPDVDLHVVRRGAPG